MTDGGSLGPGRIRVIEPAFTASVPAPALDTLSASARQALMATQPHSYLHVTRSATDDPTRTLEEVLADGRQALERLLARGAFGSADEPRVLLYRLAIGDHEQTAVVAELSVDALRTGRVRPHERTFPGRAGLLARHLEVVAAQSSPIALAHPPAPILEEAVREARHAQDPLVDFTAPDGLRQTVWAFDRPAALTELDRGPLYLLDGHHRAAAAVAHADGHRDRPGAQRLLAAVFPTAALRVFGFDRRVLEPRLSTNEVLEQLRSHTELRDAEGPFRPEVCTDIGVYAAGCWYRASVPPAATGELVDDLAPELLQRRLLEPVFGITDPQTDHRLDHLPGDRPAADAAAETDVEGGVLLTLAPVTIDELMAVADAGAVLPPKSTYFTPKVRSGVFLREL